jgi:leucyl-tRNA synthetase
MHFLYARFFVKAMRDMGVFDDTIAAMQQHDRDPDGLFDEPFMVVRNQGQILGEERVGDRLVVDGEWVGGRVVASRITVSPAADAGAGLVVGELMRRTENTLQVATADGTVTVEAPAGVLVEIAGVPGENTVSQLKHHLDIQRMSKSKGNVVNPDDLVRRFGADTVRTYLMFAFEWFKGGPWDSRGIIGAHRFIQDVWRIGTTDYQPGAVSDDAVVAFRRVGHQTIVKVGADIEEFKWNTAIAALMSYRNQILDAAKSRAVSAEAWAEAVDLLLLLLAPFAPHITEELWRLTHDTSIHLAAWPVSDPEIAKEDVVTMVVQVNGKVRDRMEVAATIDAAEAERLALASEKIASWTESGVRKVIARPPNLVNIVV